MPRKIKRRQYFIKAKFQIKYIAYILSFLYAGAIIAGYTVYWTIWSILGEKLANVYPQGRLLHIFHQANWTLFLRLLLITPVFVIIGTLLSHRIAGPVFRISRVIDELKQGEFGHVLRLRKHDELKGLAAKVDTLRVKMKENTRERNKLLSEMKEKVEKNGPTPELLENIKKLEELA